MKQFSIFCNEKSLVIRYPSESNDYVPKTSITFDKIKENLTFGDISWLSVIITIILCTTLILTSAKGGFESPFFLASVTFCVIGSLKFVNAIEKIIRINFTKDGRCASRIHSAIHQAINAMIKDDTLAPTIESIQKASRFNSNCETVYTFESILLGFFSIPIVLLTHKSLLICLLALLFLRCVIENLLNAGAFNFLQILILRKPTNEEITVMANLLSQNNELYDYFKTHVQDSNE